ALLEWLAALNRPAAAPGTPGQPGGEAADAAGQGQGVQRLLWRDAPGFGAAARAAAQAGRDGPAADARTAAPAFDVAALLRDAAGAGAAADGALPAALAPDAAAAAEP